MKNQICFSSIFHAQTLVWLAGLTMVLTSCCRFPLLPRGAESEPPTSIPASPPTHTPPPPTDTPPPPTAMPTEMFMPNVIGMTVTEAISTLNGAHLRSGQAPESEYSGLIAAGRVVRTDPPPGEPTHPGTWVALIVSKGPEPPAVPPGTVTGRVLWNEIPVKDARVEVRDEYSGSPPLLGEAVTDAQGRFQIASIPAGDQYLYVFGTGPEFWVAEVMPFTMRSGSGSVTDDIYLCKGFAPIRPIKGSVVTERRPILRWDPYPDAADYAVRVIKVGDSNFIFQKGDDDPRITSSEILVAVDLAPGDYRWRVDAFNSNGHIIGCSYYGVSDFTVQ